MEEKRFNNAIEKSENLSRDAKHSKKTALADHTAHADQTDGGMTTIKRSARGGVRVSASEVAVNEGAQKPQKNREKKAPPRGEVNEEVLLRRQEEEERKAEARIMAEDARKAKKEAKKEAKRRSSQEKAQAKERERESIEQLKLQKRAERLAHKSQMKHEREQRRAELKAERLARQDSAKQKRISERARLRRERAQARKQKHAQRVEERREKRQTRSSRGIGGWLAAVIVLGCSTLILTTMLVFNNYMSGGGANMLAGSYSKAFYDLVGYVDNIDVNLSKIAVTNDEQSAQRMLADLMVQSNLAAEDLQALPLHDQSRHSTVKFINQLGDFSKYLNNKLISGEKLSTADKNNLEEFKRINGTLKMELNDLATQLGDKFDFSTMLSGEENSVIFERFNKLEANAVDYPKMIYDGPFADSPQELAPIKKGGKRIDEEGAIKIASEIFESYGLEEIEVIGKTDGKEFEVYNLTANFNDEQLFMQISQFGELVTFDCYSDCQEENYSRDQAIEFGYDFLKKCGYKSIKAVWTTQSNGICYINFAGIQDQIVLYSDLIKVSVCMGSGRVYSMDANAYVKNHKQREIASPALRVEQAEAKLSSKMHVMTSRLALIPLESGKEKLAYEFFCETKDGEEYYVYIDAVSGSQLEMFKVVLTDEGTLLL